MSDEAGFAAFVRAHSRSLYGTAYLLTGSPHAAEDLLQDTLTHLYPQWRRVAEAEQPVAYVRRALTNRFISARRRPGSRDLPLWTLPDTASALDVADLVAENRLLWQLLLTLPVRQRAALVLRYFHDLPDNEIARALGTGQANVRSLVSRGLSALRAQAATSTGGGAR